MSNINTNDDYGSFVKYSGTQGQYTYSYSSLILNESVSDQDQIIVIRQFTPTDAFEAAATPDGLGGTKITGSETWDSWTLPNTSSSGSSMYTIDTIAKTITMSGDAGDYAWDRSGTTINLPAFNTVNDTIIISRKTYGVNPFVEWTSGSRLTSSQLNHETKQLLYLTQEIHDKIFQTTDLDPYYGAASGICPLNSSGTIDSGYIDGDTINFSLLNIVAGDGLASDGALGDTLNLLVSLQEDTALSFLEGALTISLDANNLEFTSNVLGVKLKPSGTILEDSTGIYVDITDSVTTTSSIKALSATGGKAIKDALVLLGTGIQYLGSFDTDSPPTPPGTLEAGMTYDIVTTTGNTASPFLDGGTSGSPIAVEPGDFLRYKTEGGTGWYKAQQPTTVDLSEFFKHDGSVKASDDWVMDDNKITELKTPTASTDAATMGYVDDVILSDLADVADMTTQGTMLFRDSTSTSWEPILLNTATPTGTILTTADALEDFSNIDITGIEDNDLLRYNTSTGKWVNTGAYSSPQTFYSSGEGVNAFGTETTGSSYEDQGTPAYGYGDGIAAAFELGDVPDTSNSSSFVVSIDGVIQKASDYSISGSTLTFSVDAIPPYGSEIYVVVFGITPTVTGAINATDGDFSGYLNVTGNTTLTTATVSGVATLGAIEGPLKYGADTYPGYYIRQIVDADLSGLPSGQYNLHRNVSSGHWYGCGLKIPDFQCKDENSYIQCNIRLHSYLYGNNHTSYDSVYRYGYLCCAYDGASDTQWANVPTDNGTWFTYDILGHQIYTNTTGARPFYGPFSVSNMRKCPDADAHDYWVATHAPSYVWHYFNGNDSLRNCFQLIEYAKHS